MKFTKNSYCDVRGWDAELVEKAAKLMSEDTGASLFDDDRALNINEDFYYLKITHTDNIVVGILYSYELQELREVTKDEVLEMLGETKPTAHPHAELMLQYAQDAAETSEPWRRWQSKLPRHAHWNDRTSQPLWDTEVEYRRKPEPKETITINGKVLNAPYRKAPEFGTEVYLISFSFVTKRVFQNNNEHVRYLKDGRIFKTWEDAEAVAKVIRNALLGKTGNN